MGETSFRATQKKCIGKIWEGGAFPEFRGILNTSLIYYSSKYCYFLSSQSEIVKRLSAIVGQVLPFLSQEVSLKRHPNSLVFFLNKFFLLLSAPAAGGDGGGACQAGHNVGAQLSHRGESAWKGRTTEAKAAAGGERF